MLSVRAGDMTRQLLLLALHLKQHVRASHLAGDHKLSASCDSIGVECHETFLRISIQPVRLCKREDGDEPRRKVNTGNTIISRLHATDTHICNGEPDFSFRVYFVDVLAPLYTPHSRWLHTVAAT